MRSIDVALLPVNVPNVCIRVQLVYVHGHTYPGGYCVRLEMAEVRRARVGSIVETRTLFARESLLLEPAKRFNAKRLRHWADRIEQAPHYKEFLAKYLAVRNLVLAQASTEPCEECEECGALIPDAEPSIVNTHHGAGCSLHTANVV